MMNENKFYETIFRRKSIRQYDLAGLDVRTLAEIMARTGALKPLFNGIKIEIKLLLQKDVRRFFSAKAPHYLAIFSEAKDGHLANVGFMLQQMDLFFSTNGIGSCWQGIPRPAKEFLRSSKLEFAILLAFGKPKEKLHRESVSEFERKPLGEITDIKGADELLEPARLAPSAMNRQHWFFRGDASAIHACRAKSSFLTALMLDRMDKISMGIAIYHVWIAAKHLGKEVELINDKEAQNNPPPGHDYVSTIKIK